MKHPLKSSKISTTRHSFLDRIADFKDAAELLADKSGVRANSIHEVVKEGEENVSLYVSRGNTVIFLMALYRQPLSYRKSRETMRYFCKVNGKSVSLAKAVNELNYLVDNEVLFLN